MQASHGGLTPDFVFRSLLIVIVISDETAGLTITVFII